MAWLTAHWAILGKTPKSLDDYGVIACSTGAITSAEFGMWLKAFTSGTMEPKALPRVSTSHFTTGPDHEPWLGLSVQTLPESQDGFHRPYAMTYYACVRWADVVAAPTRLSYRAMYEALMEMDFSGEKPFRLPLSAYDERRLAEEINGTARRAAALLLTGRPVCVVRAGRLSLDRRLDFLDAVAALLPYGFRHSLAVSTWTNSASRHRIRLSFAEVAPTHGTWELPWEAGEPVGSYPQEAQLYEKELERHQGADLGELVRRLATAAEPRDFEDVSDRAAAARLLQGRAAGPVALPPRLSVEDLLRQCGESIANAEERRLGALTTQLARRARERVPDEDRKTYRVFARANPVRLPESLADSAVVQRFFESLLRLLYGTPLRAADVEEMLVDLGGPRPSEPDLPPALLAATDRLLPHSTPSGRLLIANLLGPDRLYPVLDTMSDDELCGVAVQSRNRRVLDIVIDELGRRAAPTDPRSMESVRHTLTRYRYLIEAIGSICAAEESVRNYQLVLWLSHQRQLTPADIDEVLANVDRPSETFLLGMAALSAPGTASTLLYAVAGNAVRGLGLAGTAVADSVTAGLDRMTAPANEGKYRRSRWRRRRPGPRRPTRLPVLGLVLLGTVVLIVIAGLVLWLVLT
ncbi:hypothetical protein ABGB18_31210 [Nonomuraea sp. B12E4]|uniref:hypothetical protein n=1 Tax=Nonomuraea sp. B12E4 TaxID=3153564 RepID=UPI00325F2BCD